MIFIIDDDPQSVEPLANFLEANGIGVKLILNANDALREFDEAKRPDLVVLDLSLPGQIDGTSGSAHSGMMVLDAIRRRWSDVPVVVYSVFSDDAEELVNETTRVYGKIPTDPWELGEAVLAWIKS